MLRTSGGRSRNRKGYLLERRKKPVKKMVKRINDGQELHSAPGCKDEDRSDDQVQQYDTMRRVKQLGGRWWSITKLLE